MDVKWIESGQNKQFKAWHKLLKKKGRDKAESYLLEGFHSVEEALRESGSVQAILLDEKQELPFNVGEIIQVYRLKRGLFQALISTEHSQGILAVCKIHHASWCLQKGQRLLLLDAIQDPGNLGTLIRTADAVGLDAVILGDGCVDLYNDKVLRSAQGSHGHIPIIQRNLFEVITRLKEEKMPVYGTALQGELLTSDNRSNSFALLMGNEANGVQPDLLREATAILKIPLYGQAESLNVAVAAGIFMYFLRGL